MSSKKGQKFGRHRDRSPAAKMYKASNRSQINKVKKLKRHVRKHLRDLRNASALTSISKGEKGPTAVYTAPSVHQRKHTPDGVHDVDVEYRKHLTVHEWDAKQQKRVRKIKLLENVASGPIYWVEGHSVTKATTPFLEEAEACFTSSHGATLLIERNGDKSKVLKNKRATPPKGFDNQFRRAYGIFS